MRKDLKVQNNNVYTTNPKAQKPKFDPILDPTNNLHYAAHLPPAAMANERPY